MISYDDYGSGDRAVIALHGVGSGRRSWVGQAGAIVDAGWRLIAVDAPGYGKTPLPDEPGFGPHVEAVILALDLLELDEAVICGHSLGGMTAQEVYARAPERVSGLVLSATSPAFGKPDGDFQKKFVEARLKPFEDGKSMPEVAAASARNLLGPKPRDGAELEIIAEMSQVSIEAFSLAVRTLTAFDRRANLPNITVPTICIAGDHDRNSPAPMVEKMASKIPGAEYVCLEDVGHMAPVEASERFNEALVGFLGRVG